MVDRTYWGETAQHRGAFFRILHTTSRTQTGMMTIPAGQEAGPPGTHKGDQAILVLEGTAACKVWSAGNDRAPIEKRLGPGGILVVPAGIQHWVKSKGPAELVFFTVYGPPSY